MFNDEVDEMMEMPSAQLSARPVTWREVREAARMGNWSDRFMLFFYPWPDKFDNIRMWLMIGSVILLGIVQVYLASQYMTGPTGAFIIGTIVLALFSAVILYSSQITSGLSERLAERMRIIQQKILEKLRESVDNYGEHFAQQLREATGRTDIKADPISMAAAVISVSKKREEVKPITDNPFRAILDGTITPQDLMPPPVSDEDDSDFDFLK